MKKLIIVLVLLVAFTFSGCVLLDWITPEPVPEPVMEANVDAVLAEEGKSVVWSIENIGSVNIYKYVITFDVFYPMLTRDNVILKVTDYALGIGEKDEGVLNLPKYDTAEAVSVTWELFD